MGLTREELPLGELRLSVPYGTADNGGTTDGMLIGVAIPAECVPEKTNTTTG